MTIVGGGGGVSAAVSATGGGVASRPLPWLAPRGTMLGLAMNETRPPPLLSYSPAFSGPGKWHIVGNAKVHTPWPLPDFSVHIDEHFVFVGAERLRVVDASAWLKRSNTRGRSAAAMPGPESSTCSTSTPPSGSGNATKSTTRASLRVKR